ncbi:MAG: diacylglycerol/lipid kinase family protein [Planctomycetota bacterium]
MSERPPGRPVRKVQVIVNPISGRSGRRTTLARYLDALRGHGVEAAVVTTEAPGHATALAREACDRGVDAVVAAAGDGTVNEVLNGLGGDPVALSTMPMGGSNMLARDLKLPFDPVRAARVLAGGRRYRMDVGNANGRRFVMVVGVGWDAQVVNAVCAARRGHLGRARYIAPIARAAIAYDFPELTIRIDGEDPPRRGCIAFVCNTRNYASWFAIAPEATPDDGALDFLVLSEGSARDFVRWGIAAFRGTLPRYREVEYVKGREIEIEAQRPVPFQVDGDPGGTTPLTVTLEEGALEVIVP